MPNPLISLRLDPDLLAAIDRFAAENGLDRTTVIRSAVSQYINVPIDPIEERLSELERRIERVEAEVRQAAIQTDISVECGDRAIAAALPTPSAEGISQNELIRLCRCNDRTIKRIRESPAELAEFTRDRTGQAYEYREGKYFPGGKFTT